MKTKRAVLAMLLGGSVLLAACAGQGAATSGGGSDESAPEEAPQTASSSQPQDSEALPTEEVVYRGEVTEMGEEAVTVAQLPGYDYGQTSIVFHLDDDTGIVQQGVELAQGAFVNVLYDGRLTRSLPPQATALEVEVVAPTAAGVLQNGVIQQVEQTEDGYRIDLLPFGAPEAQNAEDRSNLVVLTVPETALEQLSEEDLVAGAEVSAVTKGIATASLPPQMPVTALLPYTA